MCIFLVGVLEREACTCCPYTCFCAGTHDVLRVALTPEDTSSPEEGEGGERTVLLPFASEVVPVVDRDSRRMEITPPVGLLDLVTVAKESRAKPKRGR